MSARFGLLAVLAVAACTKLELSVDAGPCLNDLPPESACNGLVPAYSADIAPLVAAQCGACHSSHPTDGASYAPLDSYATLAGQRTASITQINTCNMPPAPAMMSEADRKELLTWLVCGAPDN